MKIIQVLILMLLCLDFQSVKANSTYVWGDTLHVWATSGLNMREGPGTDFPKMKKLEYGDKVQVIDNYLRSTPLNITVVKKSEKSDEFILKGFWVRVIIGSQEGYVFDGYLSRMPVLKFYSNNSSETNHKFNPEWYLGYFEREFGVIDTIDNRDIYNVGSTVFNFKKEINIQQITEKGAESIIKVPNITFNEGYLFFNVFSGFEDYLGNKENFEFTTFNIKNDTNGITIFITNGANRDVSISIKNGIVIISEFGYC
jgi:hypothetical protein